MTVSNAYTHILIIKYVSRITEVTATAAVGTSYVTCSTVCGAINRFYTLFNFQRESCRTVDDREIPVEVQIHSIAVA